MGRFQAKILAAISIAVLLLTGCEYFFGSRLPLESDVIFTIYEGHGYSDSIFEPQILIGMETEKEYGLGNYAIIAHEKVRRDKVLIDIEGIWEPDMGTTVIAPASWDATLDLTEGEYELNISYKLSKDVYRLVVTDTTIEIYEEDASFTLPESSLAWRLRSNSYVMVAESDANTRNDFIDSVKTVVDIREFSIPDSGITPYYGEYSSSLRYFSYSQEDDFAVIGQVLEEFTPDMLEKYPNAEITIRNWRNEAYSSDP